MIDLFRTHEASSEKAGNYGLDNPEGRQNIERDVRNIVSEMSVRLSEGGGVDASELFSEISNKMTGKIPIEHWNGARDFAPQFGYPIKSPMGYHLIQVEIGKAPRNHAYGGRYYATLKIQSPPEPGVEIRYDRK